MNFSIDCKKLFGTTFSPSDLAYRACNSGIPEIGKWRDALDAMDELGDDFNFLRIGAYWNHIETSEKHYRWEELDELLTAVEEKKKYEVLLTVGMKAPRWPEYYIPDWALPTPPDKNAEISNNQLLRERTKKFIEAVVNRYKNRNVIKAWQVENEPMDRSGEHHWFIGADFVNEEAKLIRSLDKRPLVINCWCENQIISSSTWPVRDFSIWTDKEYAVRNAIQLGDILGLDIYPNIDGHELGNERRTKDLPTNYIQKARDTGKDAWVIESQAEPWGEYKPGLDKVKWLVAQHIEQGFPCVLLWGFEWWWEMRFTDPACSKEWFDHIRWEAQRFGMLSRVFHNWTTKYATNLASDKGRLYLTVVGDEKQIWLLSSNDDGKNWTPSQVLADKNWQTEHPVGIAVSQGKLYLTVVGDEKQIWLLSSNDDGKNWTPSQVLADKNWQTEHPVGIAVSQGKLYLTVVGDNKQIWLLSSNDDGKNWTPSQVLADKNWQTEHPVGIAVSQGKLYLTVVGDNKQIWLLFSNDDGKNWTPSQVLADKNWQTEHPVGIAVSQGKLYLTVVGDNKEIWLLSSTDKENNYKTWEEPQSGIFKDWQTDQAISITEFKEGSNSSESRVHLSLVGSQGEIYICTDNPVVKL